MWQTEALSCSVGSVGEQFSSGLGHHTSHEKYPGWTLPGHMPQPLLRQRVGLLPLSTECQAAGSNLSVRVHTAASGE